MALDKRQTNTAENVCDEGPNPSQQQKVQHMVGPTSLEQLKCLTSTHKPGQKQDLVYLWGWEGLTSSSISFVTQVISVNAVRIKSTIQKAYLHEMNGLKEE